MKEISKKKSEKLSRQVERQKQDGEEILPTNRYPFYVVINCGALNHELIKLLTGNALTFSNKTNGLF